MPQFGLLESKKDFPVATSPRSSVNKLLPLMETPD